jgi:hypothetical protein
MAIRYSNQTGLSIKKFLESPCAGKHPKLIKKGTKAAAAEAAVTVAEAIAVVDLEEAQRLAAKSEALAGGALTMALAQEAEPGDPSRECWLAHERLRVSEARSINRAEILTACTDTAAELADVAAVEAAAAEAADAVDAVAAAEAAAAVESAAAAGAAAKAVADAPGAKAALAPKLPKEPGGGAGGMAEGAEKPPGRPVFSVEAEPGDPLRECWLAHERLRVSEARSINRAEILTARSGILAARTDAAAEVAEVTAAEAAAAEAAAAVEAVAAAEAAAAAGAAAKAAADAPGA